MYRLPEARTQSFTEHKLEQLDGMLLGDWSLFNPQPKRRQSFSITAVYKEPEMLEWLAASVSYLDSRPIWDRSYFDKRTQKTYTGYWMRSLTFTEFSNQRKRWYPEGIKRLPEDVRITPVSLLHWYLDDGGVVSNTYGNRKNLPRYLASDDFTLYEVEYLCHLIEGATSIEAKPHKNEENYRIYIPARYADTFLDFIGPCPVRCYDYKWCR